MCDLRKGQETTLSVGQHLLISAFVRQTADNVIHIELGQGPEPIATVELIGNDQTVRLSIRKDNEEQDIMIGKAY